jgi:hypothetical protein
MIVLGTNGYDARGDAGRRQSAALATWPGLPGVHAVNLQWPDEVFAVDGFATEPVLRLDSRTVSRRQGPRKPILPEMLDRLAQTAVARGARWFGYANSDIRFTPAAVERVEREGRQAYAFARMELEPGTGEPRAMLPSGTDAFFFTPAWWAENRHRFRPYIAGEPIWDNVYAAITLCHSDGVLVDNEPLIAHEAHEISDWRGSPFAAYLRWLSALDAPYFSLWASYYFHLVRLRERGASAEEEAQLQRRAFRFRPSVGARLVQAGREIKAHLRYRVAGR